DGDSADESCLDRLPCLLDAVAQRARLFDGGELRFERDAVLGWLVELHRSDWRIGMMLPQEGHRVLEHDAQRLNDVANAISFGRCGDATDNAFILLDRLHGQEGKSP